MQLLFVYFTEITEESKTHWKSLVTDFSHTHTLTKNISIFNENIINKQCYNMHSTHYYCEITNLVSVTEFVTMFWQTSTIETCFRQSCHE